jgi:hypothetical protein
MAKYQVDYDLRKPGRNYEPLYKRLADWRAVRVLKSTWVMETTSNATTIRDDLAKYIDSNDGILVTGLTGEAAWKNLEGASDQFFLGKRVA